MINKTRVTVATAVLASFFSLPALAQLPFPKHLPLPHLPGLEILMTHGAPPALRSEWAPRQTDPGAVWIRGYWHWDGYSWVWIAGRWARPEYEDGYWVESEYVREYDDWRYVPGHWSYQRPYEGNSYRQWRARDNGSRPYRSNDGRYERDYGRNGRNDGRYDRDNGRNGRNDGRFERDNGRNGRNDGRYERDHGRNGRNDGRYENGRPDRGRDERNGQRDDRGRGDNRDRGDSRRRHRN